MIDQSEVLRRAAKTGEADDIDYASYICGFEPPNFKLPALPVAVIMDNKSLFILHYRGFKFWIRRDA